MKRAIPTITPRQTPTQVTKSTPDVQEQIRLRAYELYEQRENDSGHELDDWLGRGRPERRVTFEAKKSSVSQITKRSRTRRVRTLDKHCYYS